MDHQSIAQILGSYGEFIGAIAVVATLFYFARQIRGMQSSQLSEVLANTVDGEMVLDQIFVENAELIVNGNSGEHLSDADELRLRHIYHAIQSFHFHYYVREQQTGNSDIRAQAFASHLVKNPAFLRIFHSREWGSDSRPAEFAANVRTYLNDPVSVENLRKWS
jgi:hypothetical protein